MHLHISKLLITGFVRRLSGNGAGFANKSVGNCYSLNLQTTNDPFNHQMHDIIDVRSPLEYQDDHIPGAINLPVLSNYERHIIGQEYNQNSFEARRHGASLISRNIHKILHDHFMDKEKKHSFLVYCWRGGQRSKSFALVLNMIGYTVKCLDGGYKNYRKQIVSRLSCISSQLRYNVITGMTGTGKTLLLNYLEDIGEQVLDLEALANHKGSVLGRNYENQSQPSTRWFESCLYHKLASFDKSKPVWVEAEGRRIGDLQIPDSVFTSISSNILHCYTLEADIESRIRYIMSDYDYLCKNPAILKQELGRLQKLRLPLRSLIMSARPKYFYNLSIYNPVIDQSHSEKNVDPQDPPGWYFPIGVGKHVLSFLESTKTSGKKLTTKGSDLLDYASSLEGTVKIGFIASCTCAGGLMSLIIRPKGKIRKLFYPSLFLATSSAICYPSTAYIVAKTGLVYAYNGSESVYNISKQGVEKISEWRSAAKMREEQVALKQQTIPVSGDMIEKTLPIQNSKDVDMAPLKNTPILFKEDAETSAAKAGSEVGGVDSESNSTSPAISQDPSIVDLGQSSVEDKDLYTTRL